MLHSVAIKDGEIRRFGGLTNKKHNLKTPAGPAAIETDRRMVITDMPATIAALYVEKNGSYANLPGVDIWDQERDARMYGGPHPVVAHPPCTRWCTRWYGNGRGNFRHKKGDDHGCFKSALFDIRAFGGVLEHPQESHAWKHFGLARPPRSGGWVRADDYGWTCRVEQGFYGHWSPKPTWLYAVGCRLPEIKWGSHVVSDSDYPADVVAKHGIDWCRGQGLFKYYRGEMKTNTEARIYTPPEFRSILIDMARSARWKGHSNYKMLTAPLEIERSIDQLNLFKP